METIITEVAKALLFIVIGYLLGIIHVLIDTKRIDKFTKEYFTKRFSKKE